MFHAPWCGHCKELKPKWKKLTKTMRLLETPVVLGQINAEKHHGAAEEHNIEGYPTLILFRDSKPTEYQGNPDPESLERWVKKNTGPSSILLNSGSLEELSSGKTVSIVYFGEKDDAFKAYMELADETQTVDFFHTHDLALKEKYGNHNVIIFKDFEGGNSHFDEDVSNKEALSKFIDKNRHRSVLSIDDPTAIDRIFEGTTPGVFFFSENPDKESQEYQAFQRAADHYKGHFVFITAAESSESGNEFIEYIGITKFPSVAIAVMSNDDIHKYIHDGEISDSGFIELFEKFNKGELK